MSDSRQWLLDPRQWLADLDQIGAAGYDALLALHDGALSLAAYDYAAAQNRTRGLFPTPKALDLRMAALHVERHCSARMPVPSARVLALDCEAAGLPVLP